MPKRIAIPALALVILAALLLAANTAHNAREQHRQNLAELRHEAAYLAWENEQIARHNRQLREQHAEELERLIKSAGEQDTYTVIPAATITKYAPHDCPPSCGLCFAGDRNSTATGSKPKPGQTAAVDPAYIPLGSRIYVEELGWYEANDTGGDVRGWHVDIVAANHVEAEQWGVQERLIIIEGVGGL